MNPYAKRLMARMTILTGLAMLLFAVSASAAAYKGKFTIQAPVQWGDAVLQPGTYELSMSEVDHPNSILVRGSGGGTLVAYTSTDDLPAEIRNGVKEAQLKVESVNGTPVVRTLLIPQLGKAYEFPVPKDVRAMSAAVPVGKGGCSGKL